MVVRLARLAPPLECVRLYDLEAGLDGFIAIHSTACWSRRRSESGSSS